MLNVILPKIPAHRIYCEPFFGGGAVFFAKMPAYLEVINDSNDRLIIFYEQMRDNFDALNELISTTLHSESIYSRARNIFNSYKEFSNLEIAWSVYVLSNMSFAATFHGGWKWCNGSAGSHSARYIARKTSSFILLKNRLSNVQISKRDALKVIADRDTKNTFFYLDPPYPGCNQSHYSGYSMRNFTELLELLETIKGKFLLSNFWNQTLKYYCIKNDWNVDVFKKEMKVANFSEKRYKNEILISNYTTETNLFSNLS